MLVLIMAALLQAQASAPVASEAATSPANPVVTRPDWRRLPTRDDLLRVYPSLAKRTRVRGAAIIACEVDEKGLLIDCFVKEEAPTGSGFGDAAIKLSRKFRMRPQTRNGVPVRGGTVTIPIRFDPP